MERYSRGLVPSDPRSLSRALDFEFLKLERSLDSIIGAGGSGISVGSGGIELTVTAGAPLGGNRAVYIASDGLAYYADQANATARFTCGVTTAAAAMGNPVTILIEGVMTEPTWSWTTGDVVWLGATGLLTQVVPTVDYLFQVGTPAGPTKLRIEPHFIAKI